eukprot:scaffold72790_cov41-Prasinocladus_malaysianus.AAC.1
MKQEVASPEKVVKPEEKEGGEDEDDEAPMGESSAPLTYAQRLRLSAAKPAAAATSPTKQQPPLSPTPAAAGSATADVEAEAAPTAALTSSAPTTTAPTRSPAGAEPGSSVFVRFLPPAVDEDILAREFSKFGTLLSTQQYPKGAKPYAFVDFTTAQAATAAIQAGIVIDGRTISVEEKRPSIIRGGSRGGGRDGRQNRGGYQRHVTETAIRIA